MVSIISIGFEVAKILGKGQRSAYVLAVFSRSFYVQCDHDVFCIGVASLGQGPLQLQLNWHQDSLPWHIYCGLKIDLEYKAATCLQSRSNNPSDIIAPDNKRFYRGKVSGVELTPASLQKARLTIELIQQPGLYGFSWVLDSARWHSGKVASHFPEDSYNTINRSLYRQCIAALQCLFGWLTTSLEASAKTECLKESGHSVEYPIINSESQLLEKIVPPTRLIDLLGAGPGLTPAGDDLLAGVMLALHRSQRAWLADMIWQLLEPHLVARTNVISIAHLRLAAQGQCSEPMFHLIEGVFGASRPGENDLPAIIADVQALANRIGASSGWDSLAGLSLVLRAFPDHHK